MDQLDMKILECLRKNARMPASAISKAINLSVSSVIDRIRKLEERGVIIQYTTVIDPKLASNEITMLVGIKLDHPRRYDELIEIFSKMPNIYECNCLTGDLDFMLKVSAESTENLQEIHRTIANIDGVASLTSYYVLRTSRGTTH